MVVLIMGVSGSGKSTVGEALARTVHGHFCDADDHHPPENIAKMRAGTPLTDADRDVWLQALRSMIDAWLLKGGTHVLACSALTERIRRVLGVDRDGVRLVYLHGSKDLIAERMRAREHFMPPALLESQFALLEPPEHAVDLDIRKRPQELVTEIVRELGLR